MPISIHMHSIEGIIKCNERRETKWQRMGGVKKHRERESEREYLEFAGRSFH